MLQRNSGTFTLYVWAVADPENFGGGGFEAQNLKNSDVFTKIETDFSAEIGNSNVFFAQIQVVSKKKKKKKKRSSPKLRLIFRPKSEIQTFFSPKFRWSPKKKKKKKKVFTKIETNFSAEIGNSNVFFAQIQVVSKKKKKKKKRSSPKLRLIFRPKSEIQTFFSPKFRWSPKKKKKKKKKKGLHQN